MRAADHIIPGDAMEEGRESAAIDGEGVELDLACCRQRGHAGLKEVPHFAGGGK